MLFNVDFSDETDETISTTEESAVFVSKTYDGYGMSFGVKAKKDIKITKGTGLVFENNNYSNYSCLAIPLTLTANNEVTVAITLAKKGKIKYGWRTGILPETPSAPEGTTYSTEETTNTIKYTPTTAGTYVLYLGRSGSSSGHQVKSIEITQSASSSGGETPDPDQPGTGGDGDSDGCTKIFWFANDADATAAGVENNTTTFSGANSGNNSASGSITIDGKSYSVTKRGGTNNTSITFSVPANKVGTLYGLAITSSSSGAARTLTLTNTASYSKTQSTSTSQSVAGEFTFTDMPAGSYTLAWGGNGAECMLCLKLCDADAPSCTAPTNVAISGAWDKFGGETISLTATPTGGAGDYSYQWQKYYGSTWNNITDNATATTANLVYENCDGSHSGTYRCVVSTGTDCSTASDGLQVKVYTLECYTNGTNIYHFTRNGNTQSGTLTLDLNANTAYKFKVHVDNDYYGNGGTINKDETNWVLGAELGTPDLTVNSGLGGTFTFTIDYSASGNSNTLGVPEISVTYPRKTIYLNPGVWNADGAKYAIYYFIDGHNAWSDLLVGNACGTYTTIPQWNGVTMIAVRLNSDATEGAWDKKWNQTGNIPVNNNDYIEITGWGNNGGDSPYTYTTYTPATYSIIFNANSGDGSMTNVTGITCGGSTTLAANTFTRTGYTFAGWATSDNGEKVYDDKATISNITSNITLYAKWNAETYTITYSGLEGATHSNPTTYTIESETITFTAPSERTGYTFAGWDPTSIEKGSTGNKTVTATWTANDYTITYEGNHPTNAWNSDFAIKNIPTEQTLTSGTGNVYNGNTPVITEAEGSNYAIYTFVSWNTAADGTGTTYTAGASISISANTTLYAQWQAKTYNITYYDTDQTTALTGLAPISYTYSTGVASLPTPTKTGYTFASWTQWWDGGSKTNVTTIAEDAWGDVQLAAQWTAKTSTITWNANGGSVTPPTSTYTYDGATITLPTPTRDGYTFNGWFTAETEGTQITEIGTTNKPTSDVTYYAQWTENAPVTPEPEGDYCINLGLGEAPTTANGGIPSELNNVIVTLTSTGSKSTWNEDGYLNLGANDDYITFDFTNVGKITKVSFDVTIPNWAADKNKIEYKFNDAAKYTEKTISSAAKEIITLEAPENTNKFTFSREAGTGTRISSICFTLAPTTPTPDNCGISECGNATLTYTINASTSITNTADNLLSSATASNTAALGVNNKAVFSTITADEAGKAAAAANECFTPAPVMSSKITMHKGSSYNANTYLQFTFTVKSGYTFTPCDVQFIVQPVMTAANFRWVITNGTTEYGSGTANDVPVGQGNGATALLGLSSTSAMPAGTYYIRLYPYDNDDNSFRISNDVILKGTIEEVVCTIPDAPTAFAVGSITSNGATFTITDAANTNNYEIYYSTSNTAPTAETEATITTTEKTKAVTGLTAETTYYAWVRAVCNEENKSSWVALTNNSFTTSAELTPGDCVTIFEAKATGESPFFIATTGTITSPSFAESNELDVDGYSHAAKPDGALKIDPKAGETFKVGDKLTFVVYTAKDEKSIGFKIGSTTYTETISKELYYFTHTLEQGDIQTSDGQTTITFNRNSADDRWVAVKIERCAQLPSCTTPELSDLEAKRVCPGSDVTWTAIVNNTAELADGETITYQWNKKGNNTVLSNIATLTLENVTEATDGTYVVTATVSANGKASATATKEVKLTVTPATATPTITASASTVYAGNPVTLTASCASSGVSYKWYTCTDAEGNGESAIGNAKNAEYTPSTATAGTYYYKVIVTGDGTYSCGTAEKVYELVVKTPSAGCYDMIIFDSSDNDYDDIPATGTSGVEENSDATWTSVGTSGSNSNCNYTYGSKTYKKGWKFVNGSTSSDNRYIQFVIPEGYTGSLFLAAYSTSTNRTVFIDTKPTNTVNNTYASIHISATGTLGTASAVLNPGTYYVCATDGLHLVELSIEICSDVNCTDPEVTATVDNAVICAGNEAVVKFTANNAADGAEFQWQKHNGTSWENISGATNATYTINPVAAENAGKYRVIAEAGCKHISNELTLTVLGTPVFNTFNTAQSVMTRSPLSISDVQATNATGYTWYKSVDATFNSAEDTQIGNTQDLMISSVAETAGSTFYLFCLATNSCGTTESQAITVTVTELVEEECATPGNEAQAELFSFTNSSCSKGTYNSTPVWDANGGAEYLTYKTQDGKLFETAKVTIAHSAAAKAVYGYSTDGGSNWTYVETDKLTTDLTEVTIEFPEGVNAFCIGRNISGSGKGTGSGHFYLAEACFTYANTCTETTLTPSEPTKEYNLSVQMDFVEPTFTLKSGETTLTANLTYSSSNSEIATVDEEGNLTFTGMTGNVTITATYAGGTIDEVDYCACQGSYTITIGCKDQAPKIIAAAGTNLNGCNNSITLEAKMQDGTTAFADGTFQWYRDGEAIEGATSASYIVVRAGTYTVSRTYTCTTMSSNSAVVTNENVEPEVERLTPFQYYHVDKTYSNQMKNRHLFAVTSYGTYEGKRYHLTATRNGVTVDVSTSTAFSVITSQDNVVDTVMIDLNQLKGKYSEGDEIVITCTAVNSCNELSVINNSITIHVIDKTPVLALICSGAKADGTGTRVTAELTVGGDFLTGYNPADLCQQTSNTTFDPNTEWGFYTELKKNYIVVPVNGYAQFNKLNYEPFDVLLLTDYPKSSHSEAAQKIIDDMAELCDYRPLLSFKTHFQSDNWKDANGQYKYTKWTKKGFTTAPVVPATTGTYVNIVCYAHPMFEEIQAVQGSGSIAFHDYDDHNQLVYEMLTGPGHESGKGIQGFELADANSFVTIGLVHYNATVTKVEVEEGGEDHVGDGEGHHTHVQWTSGEDDRLLVAIAERQANIEARMILFSINCGAQSLQTEGGRQVILECLQYLYDPDNDDPELIEVAGCHLTFDNGAGNIDFDEKHYKEHGGTGTKGDGLWTTAANWAPKYDFYPSANNEVRIAAPCTIDIPNAAAFSVQIVEEGKITINTGKALTVRSTITRYDKDNATISPTESEDIFIGSTATGNGTLIFNNDAGDTKATVEMYSTADADTENYSAAASTWQYIGTPHSDVQNAANNYYESWLYQYNSTGESWDVIPNGGPLEPFRGYCITHPETPHTYTMTGTLTATTSHSAEIPAGKYVVIANSWTAPIQVANFEDDDLENLTDKTVYLFNTGSDPEGDGTITPDASATQETRYAAGTYISIPIHSAPYTGDATISSMQGFYVVGGTSDGAVHLDYDKLVRPKEGQSIVGPPMHAPKRIAAQEQSPIVLKMIARGSRYDDNLFVLEREDFTRGYDSGWDGEEWGGSDVAPILYTTNENFIDQTVCAIPDMEGTLITFRAGEDNEYTFHFDYNEMAEALYLLDIDTQIYTRVLKGNSYTFTCADKAAHSRFILTRKAPQIATGTDHINTGENAKAVKFIKDDKIFIFVNGMLYDATGKMVIR